MMTLSKQQEELLTDLQSREFLEERRGLYNLPEQSIQQFSQLIKTFERKLQSNS